MNFSFPRLLLIEKNKKKFCQSKLDCKVGKILYDKHKINPKKTSNKIIKKRIYSFNSNLSKKLKAPTYYLAGYGYVYKDFHSTLEWAQQEKKHVKYREIKYKKYEDKKIFKDITKNIGDIFLFNMNNIEKLDVIKVIEYENEYGKLKKNALIKRDREIYNIEDFFTKEEIDKKFKTSIKKTKKELVKIQSNYNKFKKKTYIYNK